MGTQHGEQQQEQDAGHDPGLARTAAGAFGWSFLNAALSRLGTLAVGVIMARILGPGEFGTFAVAMVALHRCAQLQRARRQPGRRPLGA